MINKPPHITLGLMMTRDVSLQRWVDAGMFHREISLYHYHLKQGHLKKVILFNWGQDAELEKKLREADELNPKIQVLHQAHPNALYASLTWKKAYPEACQELDLIKTNQMDGLWSPLIIARQQKIPLYVRTGYTGSLFAKRILGTKARLKFFACEKLAYRFCQQASVSSCADQHYIMKRYGIPRERLHVLRNYIDTSRFSPHSPTSTQTRNTQRLLYVGRLNEQKNLAQLLHAISQTPFAIDLYGDGELREELESLSKQLNVQATFHGTVPNDQLPQIYNQHQFFILPSLFEGMPKVLLEAMSCGCIPLVTPVPGNAEVVSHFDHGLCASGTTAPQLKSLLEEASALSLQQREQLSTRARQHLLENYDLSVIAEKDYWIIRKSLGLD